MYVPFDTEKPEICVPLEEVAQILAGTGAITFTVVATEVALNPLLPPSFTRQVIW
jgi:hypothetical protein